MAWYDGLLGATPGASEDERANLARSGLLQAGLGVLSANAQPGVAPIQAIAGGLLGGINSAQQGARQLQDDKFQQQRQQFAQTQMADQQDQMARRRSIQDLARGFVKPDGTFDMPGYQQALAQQDPETALELHKNEQQSQLVGLQTQKAQRDLNTAPTREIDMGSNKLTQEQQADGTWKTIATAGRFAPQQSAASAFAQKVALIKQYGGTDDDVKRALGITGASQAVPTLDSLSADDRAAVQAIVDGRYPVPTGKQATDPKWERLVAVAQQVDPTLDAGSYKARAAARQSFTSGKLGEQAKALNTLAGHLATLSDSLDQLGNSNIGILNSGLNLTASLGNSSRAKALGTYSTAAKAVGDEAAKVFAGGQSALGDRQEISHGLDPSQPDAQLRATLQTYAELVQSRLAAIEDQSQQALGYGSKSIQVVTPKAKKTFQKLAGGGPVHIDSGSAGADPVVDAYAKYGAK